MVRTLLLGRDTQKQRSTRKIIVTQTESAVDQLARKPPPSWLGVAVRVLLIAVGYFTLALVSRFFALPADSASAIWFPAGFALGVLVVLGPRYWLGIWLGASLSNVWLGIGWPSLLVGMGSGLQALVGWWLIRRLLAGPASLPVDRDLLRCLLRGGPLACLVAATVSTLLLHGLGQLPREQLIGYWLTGYSADVLGVLLMGPLIFLVWRRKTRSTPDVWLRIGLPLMIIAVLLGFGSVSRDRVESAAMRDEVLTQMQGVHDGNIRMLRVIRSDMEALERFFVASKDVTPEEFALFTATLLDRPGLVALDWLPRVGSAQRPAFEAALRTRGGTGILEPGDEGRVVQAGKRETYFPVALTATPPTLQFPYDLLGLDRSQSPLHQGGMAQARDDGQLATSAPFLLMRGGRRGVVVYMPVYQTAFRPALATVEARRGALRGYVAAALDVERLFEPFVTDASARRIDFRAQDISAVETVLLAGRLTGEALWTHEIDFGGRRWRLEMGRGSLIWHSAGTTSDRLFHVSELLLAFMAAFAVLSAASHAARSEGKRRQLVELAAQLESDVQTRTRELAWREEESRALVTHLVDGVIQIDRHGTVLSANPAVERILGWRPDELIGQNISQIVPPPHRDVHDGYLERYLRTGQAHIIGVGREVEGLHRDGRRVPLELAIGRYEVHGEVYFTGILRDISERQRTMAALETAQREAEAANQAKSAFLAAMSHEIRTPMNGVIGSVDLLRHASLTPHQMDLANTIRDSALNLLDIIDDILDVSKIEAGRMELAKASLRLAEVAESACDALLALALRSGVTLTVFVDPRLPNAVIGDELRLRQVINNLLSNAIKFSGGQARPGRVRLRLCLAAADQMRLTVSDNGIGMDAATLSHLFKPFTQADLSTTRRFGGTGLGLSICKYLVDLRGGTIDVASEPGAGAVFGVNLPLEVDPAAPALAPQASLEGLDVAIVAAQAGDGQDWAAYLEHAGARTRLYPDADTARREHAGRPGALLLLEEACTDRAVALAQGEGVPTVLLGDGLRRQPRRLSAGVVGVDRDALHRASLLRAVGQAAGRQPPDAEPEGSGWPAGAQDGPVAIPAGGPRILVAEDHEINRKVIIQQLAQLGYAADVAADGRAALARWRRGHYALLLTDVHMPEMDGYALTEAIRREEATGTRRPIIALTANAMKGEESRCLAAGMDAFLTKPVQLEVLRATLATWLPPTATEPPPGAAARGLAVPPAALDQAVLATLLGDDDPAVIAEFLHDFGDAARTAAHALRAACERQDWPAAAAVAHNLKSSSRSVGALPLGETCAGIEAAAHASQGEQVLALLVQFEDRLAAVQAELAQALGRTQGKSRS